MIIDKQIFESLTMQAKESTRLRAAMDLRNSPEDHSQRMLNALEPGTVMPIHRHLKTSETVAILQGKICWKYYNNAGENTNNIILDANGDCRCINVDMGQWHSLDCLESGTILLEAKNGMYQPLTDDEIMK